MSAAVASKAKSAAKPKATTSRTMATAKKASAHPSFIDMIKEAIVAHPEQARAGVSRPAIKKCAIAF